MLDLIPLLVPEDLKNQVQRDWILELEDITLRANSIQQNDEQLINSWFISFNKLSVHFPHVIRRHSFKDWLKENLPFQNTDRSYSFKLTGFYSELFRHWSLEDMIAILSKNLDHINLVQAINNDMVNDPLFRAWMEFMK